MDWVTYRPFVQPERLPLVSEIAHYRFDPIQPHALSWMLHKGNALTRAWGSRIIGRVRRDFYAERMPCNPGLIMGPRGPGKTILVAGHLAEAQVWAGRINRPLR